MTNDEMERQAFYKWYREVQLPALMKLRIPMPEQTMVRDISLLSWMARARQESNDG